MALPTSRPTSPNGWINAIWVTCAAHQTLKNRILLENYYLPGDLDAKIDRFVDHYNHRRYHESLSNLTPADVYFVSGVRQPQTKQGHGARSPDKRLLTDV